MEWKQRHFHGESEEDSDKREQHRNTAQESVNKKVRRGAVAVFAAPDFNEQERGNEAHLVKQKPKDEVLGGECAVERRLQQQHQCAEPGTCAVGKKREGND